jgi:Pyruvate/2-oxoacid:ferredoxin oxidoreductase gamma subunit
MTGIGGQGIQLAARTLALAAIQETREVMVFGSYGGSMRGGNTDATVVLGDRPIRTPPTVMSASFALGMHHAYWPGVASRLLPNGIAVIDSSVFRGDWEVAGSQIIAIEASTVATDLGAPQAASMVALGALAAATGLVDIDSLADAAAEALPSYRARHAEKNAEALRAGADMVPLRLTNAWDGAQERVTT